MDNKAGINHDGIIYKKIILMAVMGLMTEIFASFILTFILNLIPGASANYTDSIGGLLKLTQGVVFTTVIFAPIVEEVVFRGFLLSLINLKAPFLLANLIQAALFGLYHRKLIQGIYAFILGLFIGYLKKICGSFAYCIVFHMTLNALGLYINVLIPEATPLFVKLILFVISAATLAALFIKLRKLGDNSCTAG